MKRIILIISIFFAVASGYAQYGYGFYKASGAVRDSFCINPFNANGKTGYVLPMESGATGQVVIMDTDGKHTKFAQQQLSQIYIDSLTREIRDSIIQLVMDSLQPIMGSDTSRAFVHNSDLKRTYLNNGDSCIIGNSYYSVPEAKFEILTNLDTNRNLPGFMIFNFMNDRGNGPGPGRWYAGDTSLYVDYAGNFFARISSDTLPLGMRNISQINLSMKPGNIGNWDKNIAGFENFDVLGSNRQFNRSFSGILSDRPTMQYNKRTGGSNYIAVDDNYINFNGPIVAAGIPADSTTTKKIVGIDIFGQLQQIDYPVTGGSGSAIPLNNIIYVDSKGGNDLTARVGDILHPFKTLRSAVDSFSTGKSILVYPGTYIEETTSNAGEGFNLMRKSDGTYIDVVAHFMPGARLIKPNGQGIIVTNTSAPWHNIRITGNGVFSHSYTGTFNLIYGSTIQVLCGNSASNLTRIYFEYDSIIAQNGFGIYHSNSQGTSAAFGRNDCYNKVFSGNVVYSSYAGALYTVGGLKIARGLLATTAAGVACVSFSGTSQTATPQLDLNCDLYNAGGSGTNGDKCIDVNCVYGQLNFKGGLYNASYGYGVYISSDVSQTLSLYITNNYCYYPVYVVANKGLNTLINIYSMGASTPGDLTNYQRIIQNYNAKININSESGGTAFGIWQLGTGITTFSGYSSFGDIYQNLSSIEIQGAGKIVLNGLCKISASSKQPVKISGGGFLIINGGLEITGQEVGTVNCGSPDGVNSYFVGGTIEIYDNSNLILNGYIHDKTTATAQNYSTITFTGKTSKLYMMASSHVYTQNYVNSLTLAAPIWGSISNDSVNILCNNYSSLFLSKDYSPLVTCAGMLNINNGYNFSSTNKDFWITVNGGTPTQIILTANCAGVFDITNHINTLLNAAGIADVKAVSNGYVINIISLHTASTMKGRKQNTIELSPGTISDALTLFGLRAKIYKASIYNLITGGGDILVDSDVDKW